jgi:hypothetical protein
MEDNSDFEQRLRTQARHVQKVPNRNDHGLPREVSDALAEAAKEAESVSFAMLHGLIEKTEVYARLIAAHQLRANAVAKLPPDHQGKRVLDAFIQKRSEALAKLLASRDARRG